MCGSRRGDTGSRPPPPLKNPKNIGFHRNPGPDPLKNHKAFNFGLTSACQQNAILMAFCWRADNDPLIVVFGTSSTYQLKKRKKKRCQSWTTSDKTFWVCTWKCLTIIVYPYLFVAIVIVLLGLSYLLVHVY